MCVCMCVGVFKCSVMMCIICYEQFHINKPLLTTKTSVLYNKRIRIPKNMFVKPMLAEHKSHIHI